MEGSAPPNNGSHQDEAQRLLIPELPRLVHQRSLRDLIEDDTSIEMTRLLTQENDKPDIDPAKIEAANPEPGGEDIGLGTEQDTRLTSRDESCDISKVGQQGRNTELAPERVWKKLFKWFVFCHCRNESI